MNRVDEYPVFWPDELPFFASERETWTKTQTEDWAAWLQGAIESRTDFLLQFLSVDPALSASERFAAAVAAAASLCACDTGAMSAAPLKRTIRFRGHKATFDVGPQPSGVALAIGIDLALLAARSMLADYPQALVWEIVWTPKTDVSFRNPVLKSTVNSLRFDPLLLGQGLAAELVVGKLNRAKAASRYSFWELFSR
jgi:hypothetical protein